MLVILIICSLVFVSEPKAAVYETSGSFVSVNVLVSQGVKSVDKFGYDATVPANTSLKVQFSRDGVSWKNSAGEDNGWDSLSQGNHLAEVDAINLSGLGWTNHYFYYKVLLETSDTATTPVLNETVVYYSPGVSIDTENVVNTIPKQTTARATILALEGGNATVRGFKYGLSQTDTWDVHEDGDFGAGDYSLDITGLDANTTYYYRAYATNPEGTTYSNWLSFTTGIYEATGSTESANVLGGESVSSIDSFEYDLSAKPAGTDATVQFSQNKTSWYSSEGALGGTDTLVPGTNELDLRPLGWEGADLYYKLSLSANPARDETPVLASSTVNYNLNSAPGEAASAAQYKSDGVSVIANGDYTNEASAKLKAQVTDPDSVERLHLFFEVVTNASSFASPATPDISSSCVSGTTFSACMEKIWYVTSSLSDYSSVPYAGTVDIAGLSDATGYKWQVKACDDTQACSSWVEFNVSTPNFTVDTTAPSAPGEGTTDSPTNSTSQVWVWSAASDAVSGVASYIWRVLNQALEVVDSGTTGLLTVTTNLTESIYQFFVKAVDVAGNEGSESQGSVTVDTTPPTVSLTALVPDPNNDNTPTLTGSADGGITSLTVIEFQLNGVGAWESCIATDGAIDEALETFACTTEDLADGDYTMYVRATDAAGNTTEVDNYAQDSFTIDTTIPTVSISPILPDPTTDTTPTVLGVATDIDGLVANVLFRVDSGAWANCTADDGAYDSPSEQFTCSMSTLSEGEHTVEVKAVDDAANESPVASDTFVVDSEIPVSLSLESPGNFDYTNSLRPTFKWKAARDETAGLSKYILEIDNPFTGLPTGDFSINDIPILQDNFETNKYVVAYDNFSDLDTSKHFILARTKSSGQWSTDANSGQNDGELKEGKVYWQVKAVDKAGNESVAGRTLFVDRTPPVLKLTQINDIPFSSNNFSTTQKRLIIYGKIIDPLAGGDASLTQDENGPRVASGPKEVSIKIEKKQGLLFSLQTFYTINMDRPWYTCGSGEVTDNSKQKCDKYLPFEFASEMEMDPGVYKITLLGKDKADNYAETSFMLSIGTFTQIATPEEIDKFEKEIKELPEKEQEKAREEVEITKPEEIIPQISSQGFWAKIGNFIGNIFSGIKNGMASVAFTIGEKTQGISEGLSLAIIRLAYDFVSEPTTIADVEVEILSPTSAKISWKVNHPSTGKVNYGLNKTYPFDIQDTKRVTEHEFVLTDLIPDTVYHFEVMSQNKNYVYDANREFRTPEE